MGSALECSRGARQPRGWKGIALPVLAEAGVTSVRDLIKVPYRHPDGRVHTYRVFADGGRAWWTPKGRGLLPFGLESLPSPALAARSVLLITEGESDALAAREAFGFIGGVYVLGLPGARTWRDDWARYVEPFSLIYLLGDGDEPGRAMVWSIRRSVPWARPVDLPVGEDVRALLQRNGHAALDPYLALADEDAVLAEAWRRPTLERAIAFLRGEEVELDVAA